MDDYFRFLHDVLVIDRNIVTHQSLSHQMKIHVNTRETLNIFQPKIHLRDKVYSLNIAKKRWSFSQHLLYRGHISHLNRPTDLSSYSSKNNSDMLLPSSSKVEEELLTVNNEKIQPFRVLPAASIVLTGSEIY
jgi:hypothetical protein